MRTLRLAALAPAALVLALHADDRVSIEDMTRARTPLFARISPDGRDVLTVFLERSASGEEESRSLWRVGDDGSAIVKLADGATAPRWSPDGARVAWISAREAGRQVWIAGKDGDGARRATALAGGVLDFVFSPDGRSLAVVSPVAPAAPAGAAPTPQIHLVPLREGGARALTSVAFQIVVHPWDPDANLAFSPDGKTIAFAGKPSTRFDDDYRSDLHAVDVATGAVTRLTTRDGMDMRPVFSPDGAWIAFRTTFGKVDRFANHGLALVSRTGEVRDVGARLEAGLLDGPYWYDFTKDGRTLLFAMASRAAVHLFALDVATGDVRPFSSGDLVVARPSLSRGSERLAFLTQDAATPWEVAVSPVAAWSPKRLTRSSGSLAGKRMAAMERISWKSKDGLTLEGLLVRPRGPAGTASPAPLLTVLHGGPEGQAFHGFHPEIPFPGADLDVFPPQLYAAHGFAVFFPNFRGSGAYGEALRRAALTDWSGGYLEDVTSGVDHLVAAKVADPARLFLAGSWRSGSTKVLGVLGRTMRFRAAVALSPYPNIAELYEARDDFHLQHGGLFGGSPKEVPEAYARHSPSSRLGEIRTPLLLVHDGTDFAIRGKQAVDTHRVLLEKRVPGELILYRSLAPRDEEELLRRVLGWLERWAF